MHDELPPQSSDDEIDLLQSAVLFLLADEYPAQLEIEDIVREMGTGSSTEATEIAVCELEKAGILMRHRSAFWVARPAIGALRIADCVA